MEAGAKPEEFDDTIKHINDYLRYDGFESLNQKRLKGLTRNLFRSK